MSEQINCPSCSSRDVPEGHVERCLRLHTARTEAVALGRGYGVPEVTTSDLWAHLGHATTSPEDATRIVRQVLDLGWRPVVGSAGAHLWTSEVSQ